MPALEAMLAAAAALEAGSPQVIDASRLCIGRADQRAVPEIEVLLAAAAALEGASMQVVGITPAHQQGRAAGCAGQRAEPELKHC